MKCIFIIHFSGQKGILGRTKCSLTHWLLLHYMLHCISTHSGVWERDEERGSVQGWSFRWWLQLSIVQNSQVLSRIESRLKSHILVLCGGTCTCTAVKVFGLHKTQFYITFSVCTTSSQCRQSEFQNGVP